MPNSVNANDICKWCGSRLGTGNHSLCKAWVIYQIKYDIDKIEDWLLFLHNLVDDLEQRD